MLTSSLPPAPAVSVAATVVAATVVAATVVAGAVVAGAVAAAVVVVCPTASAPLSASLGAAVQPSADDACPLSARGAVVFEFARAALVAVSGRPVETGAEGVRVCV